ncbi:hypothetical protein HZB90_00205 [archaeon]|nr:hypothetical protein [archaeon]
MIFSSAESGDANSALQKANVKMFDDNDCAAPGVTSLAVQGESGFGAAY